MNNWITILTFTYPHEAHLAKAKLESEGIETMIKDELTAQVNNFYSNAIGGVKLMVEENDSERAFLILKESGYIKEQIESENKILLQLDKLTSKFPIIGKSILELRLIVLVALISAIIIVPIVILTLPSMAERLTKNSWCIDNFIYQEKKYEPMTKGFKVIFNNGCRETFSFRENGIVDLPGINSNGVNANWKLENNKLLIFKSDTLSNIFDGEYIIDLEPNSIVIKSKNTTLKGHPDKSIW